MTLNRTVLIVTLALVLLVTVPVIKAWAQTETREHHIFVTVQEKKTEYAQIHPIPPGWDAVALTQRILEEERILGVVYDDLTLRMKAIYEIGELESRVPDSEQRSDLSKMMDMFNDVIIPQAYAVTEDDGYVYPKNATDEEKAAIDAQEFKSWVEAGTPGEKDTAANPYCDLLSTEERSNTICHDRKDASDITGLYTCNDGTHKEDWRDCRDASGYDYANAEEAGR